MSPGSRADGERSQAWQALTGLSWRGHECFLVSTSGYENTMKHLPHCGNPRPPSWWGRAPVTTASRDVSQEKYPAYIWPVMKTNKECTVI